MRISKALDALLKLLRFIKLSKTFQGKMFTIIVHYQLMEESLNTFIKEETITNRFKTLTL